MSEIITLAHGAGGQSMQRLLDEQIAPLYEDEPQWEDAAVLDADERMAVTTDSFTVDPLFFPGGDIGKLCVTGTINDLAMRGAVPRYITVGLIIEEGLELSMLGDIVSSMRAACDEAGVAVVAGDTKVVERGSGDGLFINTTGIGTLLMEPAPASRRARPGDSVLLNGYLGDHGISVLAARQELPLRASISSDCASLGELVERLIDAVGPAVHVLRDPTRGGLAGVLNEIARQAGTGITIHEASIPVRSEVRGVCELLGFDPLQLANEGKLVAFVEGEAAQEALQALQGHPLGEKSAIIGEVTDGSAGQVAMETAMGTSRIVTMPAGELLPRIC